MNKEKNEEKGPSHATDRRNIKRRKSILLLIIFFGRFIDYIKDRKEEFLKNKLIICVPNFSRGKKLKLHFKGKRITEET